MSHIVIDNYKVYIDYMNLLLRNLTCSVSTSFSNIKDIINNSMFEKMRNINKIFLEEIQFNPKIFKSLNKDTIIKHINMMFYNTLLFLGELHNDNMLHNSITADSFYYKQIDTYDYFFYVGKFDNISFINDAHNYNDDKLLLSNKLLKASMIRYFNNHGIKDYKKYIGTYKFDLYCLVCTIKKLYIDFNINIDDEIVIKCALGKLYNEYIMNENNNENNENNKYDYISLINKEYLDTIKESDHIAGEGNIFILDNVIPNNIIPNNMYILTELINLKDDSVIFEFELFNPNSENNKTKQSEEDEEEDKNEDEDEKTKQSEDEYSKYSKVIVKYCNKNELSIIKKIMSSNIFNIINITNKHYVMNVYEEIPYDIDDNICRKIFNNILSYLHKLHNIGIIHNDIKLSNILYDEINEKYVLIDYGLATYYNDITLRVLETEIYEDYYKEHTDKLYNINDISNVETCTKLADIIMLLAVFKIENFDNEQYMDDYKRYLNKLLEYVDCPNNLPDHLYIMDE